MKYRELSQTGCQVSLIGLGTMTWGEQNTQDEGFAQMDEALLRGINFFDTAEMYPVPPQPQTAHRTETIIGNWFAARQNRSQVILATKVTGPGEFVKHIRSGPRLSKEQILAAADASLKRLKTDCIDLYQVHWPDRATNFFGQMGFKYPKQEQAIPIDETLEALETLVQSGRVRWIGVSNETAWGVHEYLRLAESKKRPRIVSIQNPYNLLNRSYEVGLGEFSFRERVGLLAYSPLGFGVLSGKYLNGAKPEGARITRWSRFYRYTNPLGIVATERYVTLARASGLDPAQMALAFVNSRPFVTSNLIGATHLDQLRSNIDSVDLELPNDVLKAIEKIHEEIPSPCP